MSEKLGSMCLVAPDENDPFMEEQPLEWGDDIMRIVESEVERLVNNAYLVAKRALNDNRDLLEHLAHVLIEQEVVSAEEFQMMLVEFKAKTIDFQVFGKDLNREALPFQSFPECF